MGTTVFVENFETKSDKIETKSKIYEDKILTKTNHYP